MGFNKLVPVLGIDPGPTDQSPSNSTSFITVSLSHIEGLVWSHGGSTNVGIEFTNFHELGSVVSVDLSIMILTSLDHTLPPRSL